MKNEPYKLEPIIKNLELIFLIILRQNISIFNENKTTDNNKCLGYSLNNISSEHSCNLIINIYNCLPILRKQQKKVLTDNKEPILENFNVKDLTNLNRYDYLFRNGIVDYLSKQPKYFKSLSHNLIELFLELTSDRNNLLKIQQDLLTNLQTGEFKIYTDSLLKNQETEFYSMSFEFIIVKNSTITHKFILSTEFYSSLMRAEIFGFLMVIIILPSGSKMLIYIDSQNLINSFTSIIINNRYQFSPWKIFKLENNNIT
jgi:hypothetical protein